MIPYKPYMDIYIPNLGTRKLPFIDLTTSLTSHQPQ